MIPSYPTVNDSASGLLTVGFNSTCNSRFPFCFTLVGRLPPILPLSGGSYFCFALVGGSRDFNYACNPNYGCSLLLDCSGQMSKHPCNNIQQVPRPPVRESSHSPYLSVDKVGTNSPCKHLIDMQVSGNESVHNLVDILYILYTHNTHHTRILHHIIHA